MTEKLDLKINTNIDELKDKICQLEKLVKEIENFELTFYRETDFTPHKKI